MAANNAWTKVDPNYGTDNLKALMQGLQGQQDTYFTVNEFHGWHRQNLLKSLRATYVDLDLGQPATRYDLDQAISILHDNKMPTPNLAIFTGRGMHLYWLLKPTPSSALPVWQAVENALVKSLDTFYADYKAKDCTRVLRIVGTVNSKNNETVHGIIIDPNPWTLHQLADQVLGERELHKAPVRSIAVARTKSGIHPKATPYRRWHLVLQDLNKIGKYYGKIQSGERDNFLFMSSVALSWFASPDSIEDEIKDMATRFCPDLSEAEIKLACQCSIERAQKALGGEAVMWQGQPVDPRYRFKRQTLWDRMKTLAAPIVRSKNLRAIVPDHIADEHEKERQHNRDRVAEGRYSAKKTGEGYLSSNSDKVALARSMKAEGSNNRVIAKKLNVSVGSISNWTKSDQKSPL